MRREVALMLTLICALSLIGTLAVFSAGTGRTMDSKFGVSDDQIRPTDAGAEEEEGSRDATSQRHVLGIVVNARIQFVLNMFHSLFKQMGHVGIGLLALIYFARKDYHLLRERRFLWPAAALILIMLVIVIILGVVAGGARRWVDVFGIIRFQPSEFAKLVLVLVLAANLARNEDHIKSFWQGFVPPMVWTALFAGLVVAERDLGTPTVMMLVAFIMLWVSGARTLYVLGSTVPAAGAFVALCLLYPHRMDRILIFLDPWKDPFDKGFQLIQALAAFARGELWGQGLGAGIQKLDYIPAAQTDFIFSVWGEEMGLAGTLMVVFLFAALLLVGRRIAVCAPDSYGTTLAMGIVALILIQASLNMGVTTGLLPTKGLPLPFISAGGSALIANLILVGILTNIGLQGAERSPSRGYALAT